MATVISPPNYSPLQPQTVLNEYTDAYLQGRAEGNTTQYGDQCRMLLTLPVDMRQSAWAAAYAGIHPIASEWERYEDESEDEFIFTLRWVIAFYTQETAN